MRIVIVGATGNVGRALLQRLQSVPDVELVGVVRNPPAPGAGGPYAGVRWQAIDVASAAAVRDLPLAFAGADAVVHLAWLLQPNHRERVMAAVNVGGLERTLEAAVTAGVPHMVVASSVGAYSPGPKRRAVDETWPTGGIATSHYARHKAVDERRLDAFELAHPGIVVTRLRPGLVMQRAAGAELHRLFAGPLIPVRWLGRIPLPVLPLPPRVVSQVVHADDLADAFARVIEQRAGGAFNVAADPVVGPRDVARLVGARWLPVRIAPMRGLLWLLWHLHVVRTDPGWFDIATSVPVMSTERARRELGWQPSVGAIEALEEAVRGLADHADDPDSPHLAARSHR